MKIRLPIYLLLLLPSLSRAQEIEGIYKFKPGITTLAVIPELEKTLKVKTKIVTNRSDYFKYKQSQGFDGEYNEIFKPAILDIRKDPKGGLDEYGFSTDLSQAPADSTHQVFYIPTISVSEIKLNEVYLFFSDGILAKMTCLPSKKISEALEVKYGAPERTLKKDSIKCTYKLTGRDFTEESNTITTKWGKENIQIIDIAGKGLDDKCKEYFFSSFALLNISMDEKYRTDEEIAEKILTSARQKKAKEELKGKLGEF